MLDTDEWRSALSPYRLFPPPARPCVCMYFVLGRGTTSLFFAICKPWLLISCFCFVAVVAKQGGFRLESAAYTMSDVDQAIADGRVPPDVTRAILLESKDRAAVVGISIVTILTFLVVCGRVVSRTFIVRRFGYDDGLAVVSLVCSQHARRQK